MPICKCNKTFVQEGTMNKEGICDEGTALSNIVIDE